VRLEELGLTSQGIEGATFRLVTVPHPLFPSGGKVTYKVFLLHRKANLLNPDAGRSSHLLSRAFVGGLGGQN
jgi:hypothetical protein